MNSALLGEVHIMTAIAAKFCAYHNACAVVACAKFCSDPTAANEVTAESFDP